VFVLTEVLPGTLSFVLVGLALFCAIDPVLNLGLCLNPSARLALSDNEKRQCCWVGACLLLSVAAGIVWLVLGKDVYLLASLYAFFWVMTVRMTFELPPQLRLGPAVSTALSVAFSAVAWTLLLLPLDEASFEPLRVWCLAALGLSFFCLFPPYLVTVLAEAGALGSFRSRRPALLLLCLSAGLLLVAVVGWFFVWFFPAHLQVAVRHGYSAATLLFALTLVFHEQLLRWFKRKFGR
jgi:hypothetical protein